MYTLLEGGSSIYYIDGTVSWIIKDLDHETIGRPRESASCSNGDFVNLLQKKKKKANKLVLDAEMKDTRKQKQSKLNKSENNSETETSFSLNIGIWIRTTGKLELPNSTSSSIGCQL